MRQEIDTLLAFQKPTSSEARHRQSQAEKRRKAWERADYGSSESEEESDEYEISEESDESDEEEDSEEVQAESEEGGKHEPT